MQSPGQTTTGDFARADRADYALQQSIAQSDQIQLTRLTDARAERARDAVYGFSEFKTGGGLGLRDGGGLGMRVGDVRQAEFPAPVYDDGASLAKREGAARLAQEFGPGALRQTGAWDDVKQGWNREYRSVLQGPSPLYEFTKSSRDLLGAITGYDKTNSGVAAFKKGDYLRGTLNIMQGFGEAGTTVFGFGVGNAGTGLRVGTAMSASEIAALKATNANESVVSFANRFPEDALVLRSVPSLTPEQALRMPKNILYVVKEDGALVIAPKPTNFEYGHVDLARGANVLAAGQGKVLWGEVKYIDNASGHYLPQGNSAQSAAMKAFEEYGFKVPEGAYLNKVYDFKLGRWVKQ